MTDQQLSDQDKNDAAANANSDDGPDEFDLAMDEFASGGSSSAANADDDDPAVDPGEANKDKDVTPPLADQADGANAKAAGDTPPAGEKSDDIWKDAPSHLREAHEAALRDAQYRLSSSTSRQAALDRELTRLREQASKKPDTDNSSDGGRQEPKTDEERTELKQLREEYPEIAKPVLEEIAALRAELGQLKQPVQQMGEAQANNARMQQYGILAEKHPDWERYATDDRFGGWLETQPRAVREAAARNVDVSDGQEAAWVLGLFKQAIGAGQPEQEKPARQTDPRRQSQLDAARDAGRNSAPTTTGVPDDFDAAADFYEKKHARQTGAHR